MARHMRARQPFEEPVVNLTPLIDVVFVILIMFIVIAPILELDQIQLASAQHGNHTASSVQENSPITLHVRKDNTIVFNGKAVKLNQLPQLFQLAKRQHPKARPQLFHDKQGQFGIYQSIKNAAEEAGFSQMDVVLEPG